MENEKKIVEHGKTKNIYTMNETIFFCFNTYIKQIAWKNNFIAGS